MKINIMAEKFGYVTQVIGPVVDVIFEKDGEDLPPIYEALRIERDNGEKLIIEVEQHIGEDTVRCVAMDRYVVYSSGTAEIRRFNDDSGAFADRYQSDRFIGSLFQRRKNRFVRWCRSRENGADHGIDQ